MTDLQNTYRIVGADIPEFEIQEDGLEALNAGTSMDYDISVEIVLSKEDKVLHYRTSVGVRKKGEAKPLVDTKTVVIFQIYDLQRFVELHEPDQFSINPDIDLSMGRVSMGFARGLISARLRQAGVSNIVLPMLPFEF